MKKKHNTNKNVATKMKTLQKINESWSESSPAPQSS